MQRISGRITVSLILMALFSACGAGTKTGSRAEVEIAPEAININTAGAEELRRIPAIGEKLALGIIEFREKHGPFRRPEHLILINGISDRRFRDIRHLVRVE